MKKSKLILLNILVLAGLYSIDVQAQTVQIGSQTTGTLPNGNTISILNGNKEISVSGLSPVASGLANATSSALKSDKEAVTTESSEQEKLEIAKNEMVENAKNLTNNMQNENEIINKNKINIAKKEENNQRQGQDLNLGKKSIITNNIGYYNKSTINQIELKAIDDLNSQYNQFPEFINKDF